MRLTDVIANIPGLAGVHAAREQNNADTARELQQVQGVMTLQGILQKQQQQQQMLADRASLPPEDFARKYASPDALLKTQGQPYTLSPGSIRYDANGKQIASAPATPPRPLADNRPEIIRLQEFAEKFPEGHPAREQIAARIGILTSRPDKKDEGTWSEPYQIGGATVQKNSVTGQIRTAVARPPVTNINNNMPKLPSGYRWAADGQTLEPIEGGPATTIAGEAAGKMALAQSGIQGVQGARGIFLNEDGSVNRTAVFQANANVGDVNLAPGSQGRSARQQIRLAIEGALRLATGAAAPDSEVVRYESMFLPSIADTKDDVSRKMNMLEDFLKNTTKYISQGRVRPTGAPAAPASPAAWSIKRKP